MTEKVPFLLAGKELCNHFEKEHRDVPVCVAIIANDGMCLG